MKIYFDVRECFHVFYFRYDINKWLKAAAYCRVSTSRPEQLCSLELQIKTYTNMMQSNSNWIFAGVLYDVESGRTGLDKMLKKAPKGKLDYIITRSISRVSRDTLEVLKIKGKRGRLWKKFNSQSK